MDLIENIARVHGALAAARADEAERIATAVKAHHVVGVLGEAEVGKTATVRQALGQLDGVDVIRVDLDSAASDGHVGARLAKQLARTVMGEIDFSLLSGAVLLPSRVERGRVQLAELLGIDGLDEILREWPSGRYSSQAGLRALETIVQRRDLVLWIDHVEAPALTPRHPLQIEDLLWSIRELSQRASRLRVVISGRGAVERDVLGSRAAFHQQGQWLPLDVPTPGRWSTVAAHIGASAHLTERLASLTGGHPATMLLALVHARGSKDARSPEDVLRELAARDTGLAARAMQHAQTLHRLGGQVLLQIARGQRPYAAAQRGRATPQEIRKVLNRLRLAGLLRHVDDWTIVNPLVALGLWSGIVGLEDRDDDASPR